MTSLHVQFLSIHCPCLFVYTLVYIQYTQRDSNVYSVARLHRGFHNKAYLPLSYYILHLSTELLSLFHEPMHFLISIIPLQERKGGSGRREREGGRGG